MITAGVIKPDDYYENNQDNSFSTCRWGQSCPDVLHKGQSAYGGFARDNGPPSGQGSLEHRSGVGSMHWSCWLVNSPL